MKICFVIQDMNLGGAATLVHDLIFSWPNSEDSLSLIVFYDEFAERYHDINKKVDVVFLHKKSTFDFAAISRLRKVLRDINPDVISSHLTCTFYVSFALKQWNCLVTHTIHSLPKKDLPFIFRLLLKRRIKHGDIKLIGCGRNVSSLAKKLYKVEVECIPNGIHVLKDFSKKQNLKPFTILTVSRLSRDKRAIDIVKAVEEIPNDMDSKLIICGDGPEKNNIAKYIKNHNLESKIVMAGYQDNVEEFYSKSHVFCLLSEREGLPITALESMNYGLPIVATNNGGNSEIVKHDYNGFLVPVGDYKAASRYLVEILNNDTITMRFSNNSRKLLCEYSISNTVRKYSDFFSKEKEKVK